MAFAALAFSAWLESWMSRDYSTFRARPREVSAQSWATIRGTMVRDSDGIDALWLKVYVGHPAVGCVMGWAGSVLQVFQQPLYMLPTPAIYAIYAPYRSWRWPWC